MKLEEKVLQNHNINITAIGFNEEEYEKIKYLLMKLKYNSVVIFLQGKFMGLSPDSLPQISFDEENKILCFTEGDKFVTHDNIKWARISENLQWANLDKPDRLIVIYTERTREVIENRDIIKEISNILRDIQDIIFI